MLLIDLDLHKPACRKIMEHPVPKHWVNDVIRGSVPLAKAVNTDKLGRMDMLFAKHCGPRDTNELINSSGLNELLVQSREQYDFVVIDLPPMGVVPDPEAVMEYADGSLLVVRQNGMRAADLNRAIRDLQRGRAKMLGCVLNDVISTAVFSGEGYGVGYGRYGRYGRYAAYAAKHDKQ